MLGKIIDIWSCLVALIPIFFFLVVMIMHQKVVGIKLTRSTTFSPSSLSSIEVAYYYNGKIEARDVTSLILQLANKGYIKIVESDEKNIHFGTNECMLVKVKEYRGKDENERIIMESLFKKDAIVDEENIRDNIHNVLKKIKKNVCKLNGRVFHGSTVETLVPMILCILFSMASIVLIPSIEYFTNSNDFSVSVIIFMVFTGLSLLFLETKVNIIVKVFAIIVECLVFYFVFKNYPLGFAIRDNYLYLVNMCLGICSLKGMSSYCYDMRRRTKHGNYIFKEIEEYKNFIKTVSQKELEDLIILKKNYFCEALPYVYVLDIYDEFVQKCRCFDIKCPSWYESKTTFNVENFTSVIDSTLFMVTDAMINYDYKA